MKSKSIIVKVTKSTHRAFKVACAQLGVTMSAVLSDAVDETITCAEAARKEWAKDE